MAKGLVALRLSCQKKLTQSQIVDVLGVGCADVLWHIKEESPLNSPSAERLGMKCSHDCVHTSGLWNNNYVDESYDPAFLTLLENYVRSKDPL